MSEGVIRRLSPADVPGLWLLKEAAGWNQTVWDLRLLFLVEPEGFYGIEVEGQLAASAGFVTYGKELAWMGMVLTAPEARRRGFARRLLEHCLEELARRGIRHIGLDATEMGRPLYEALGFEVTGVIERVRREPPHPVSRVPDKVKPFVFDAELDGRAFGADRAPLVAALAQQQAACVPGKGFACARQGARAAYFGPCVAEGPDGAAALVEWFLAMHREESVCWDVLHSNTDAVRVAKAYGFVASRRLWRMWRKDQSQRSIPFREEGLVFATAGFEFG